MFDILFLIKKDGEEEIVSCEHTKLWALVKILALDLKFLKI